MDIKVNVKDTIQKSNEDVFDAIVNPDKISNYFTSWTSEKLVQGKKVNWEFDDVGVEQEIKVTKVVKNKQISFEWKASGILTTVDITLKTKNGSQTNIKITEHPFIMNKEEVTKALQQTQGWTDFICSLKAYLYTGINLRNGLTKGKK